MVAQVPDDTDTFLVPFFFFQFIIYSSFTLLIYHENLNFRKVVHPSIL